MLPTFFGMWKLEVAYACTLRTPAVPLGTTYPHEHALAVILRVLMTSGGGAAMTTPTINYETVLTLARQLPPADQTRLAATLSDPADDVPATRDATVAAGALDFDVQQMLQHATIDDFVVPPAGTSEDARALLQAWATEDADDEDGEPWDEVLRSLDANRFSTRRLFGERDSA